MLGVALVRKPIGLTSHDVVNLIRRKLGTKRVGHSGTLDPAASGLLVVAVGPATRFLQYLPLEPKEYYGLVQFGKSTDSYDSEGQVLRELPVPEDLPAAIDRALPQFRGLIRQLPPMFSRVKVQGKPLYEYARRGEEVHREPRTVHIDTFDPVEIMESSARFHVVCSGGTYVRTLAHDLGEAIGCGAFLNGLVRTKVGRFLLEDSVTVDELSPDTVMSLRDALSPMPIVELSEREVAQVRDGRALQREDAPRSQFAALTEPAGNVFSVARVLGNMLQPDCVIPAEVSPKDHA